MSHRPRPRTYLLAALLVVSGILAPTALPGGTAQAATHARTPKTPFKATGFFQVAKKHGHWYFVTPQGEPFYASGVDTVTPVGDVDETTGQCPYCQAVANNYPNVAAWGTTAVARLRSWGFDSLGSFSDTSLLGSQMPYTVQLNMGAFQPDLFSPSFVTYADNVAATQAAPLAEDPNLIGYFTDTEPPWTPPAAGVYGWMTALDTYLALPAGSPGLAVAQQYVGNPTGFVYALATRYFQVTSAALHQYDPNHLNLGVKMESQDILPAIFQAAQPYVDVFSVEDYTLKVGLNAAVQKVWPAYVPVTPDLSAYEKWADKPLIIGEYTSLGAQPSTPNTYPGDYYVAPNQQARAAAYAQFIEPLYADAPWMVGDMWFEYFDEPQGGRPGDHENDNFGLVNVNDQPYPELTSAMALMHSMEPDRSIQTGPTCDSWARAADGTVTCTAYLPKVSYPLSIAAASLPADTVGSSYYYNAGVFAGGGKPPYKYSIVAGQLPKGLKINRKDGIIFGTPTKKAAGTSSFTVQVSDSEGSPPVTQSGSIAVSYPTKASVTTSYVRTAHLGSAYTWSLSATGGLPPYTWSLTGGALPPGLKLAADGTLSGVATSSGTYTFSVSVADSSSPAETASRTLQIMVR